MKRKLSTSILVLVLMAATWLLAKEAYAERAIWVWGMAKDIVLDATAKTDFFNFCDAPKGDATKAIGLVFLDAKPYGFNLMTYNSGTNLRNFLNEAHTRARPIKIEFLSGDKLWATPEHRAEGETLMGDVLTFNTGTTDANKRFDGIQYDVEPYLLDSKKNGDPLDWNYDQSFIWSTYLTFLTNCQAKINTYNSNPANDPDIRFGVAIPRWYSIGGAIGPEGIIDRVNYVVIMDYKDNASDIINGAQDEINYANAAGKKVYVGVETTHPTDTVDFPPSTTFYEEGNAAMETALGQVNTSLGGYTSYAGIAIHYYEDLNGPKGYEASYRRLWDSSNPYKGHFPVVAVISPNRAGEIWYKGSQAGYIQWDASDLDGGALTIKIEYSADGGAAWGTVVSSTSNTGNYLWNTSALTAGTNYLIRVTATDGSGNVGYDVSNSSFEIKASVSGTSITDLYLWNESDTSLRLKWTPPNCTPKSYRIYRSVNGGSFTEISGSPVIAVNKYIDTGLSNTNKYKYQIKAIYGNGAEGALSNSSNMLIPGSTFLIDYLEQNEGMTYNIYGSTLSSSFDTLNIKEGTKAIKLVYSYPGSGWGAVFKGTLPPVKVDLSPYKSVKFWAKGGAVGGTAVAFQLTEVGRSEGYETWSSPAVFIQNADWAEYQFNLSSFTRTDIEEGKTGNNILDIHSIGSYALFFSPSTPGGTYYVDEIKMLKGEATVGVPGAEYSFGTLQGSVDNHRFKIGPIPVSFGGFDSPWTVRVWTNNGVGADKAGLKGADGITYIPLKVWCVNYGPSGTPPDEENDYFYTGYDFGNGTNVGIQYQDGDKTDVYSSGTFDETYWGFDINGDGDATDVITATSTHKITEEPFWLRIVEDDEMDPFNVYTWRRLCWSPGAELGSPFDVYLAIDVDGKKNQQYQTTTLTLEYINE